MAYFCGRSQQLLRFCENTQISRITCGRWQDAFFANGEKIVPFSKTSVCMLTSPRFWYEFRSHHLCRVCCACDESLLFRWSVGSDGSAAATSEGSHSRVPRRVREGPFLLSRFSCSSYQVITDSPLKYQHCAGTLVMLERQQGSPCNYDTFPQPLLSLHNQLHQGCNNWFSINANAMDLERGRANTQPCCILGLTFEKGNEHSVRFQPDSGVAAAQPRR